MKLYLVFALLISLFTTSFAQNPVPIDVTALKFTRTGTTGTFEMSAQGLPAPYQSPLSGFGELVISPIENCTGCQIGNVFPTDFGWTGGTRAVRFFYPQGPEGDTVVKFYLTGTSTPLVLAPTLLRKPRVVVLKGRAEATGRIEILYQGNVIAVDDDVKLIGTVKAEMYNYLHVTYKRAFDFKSITYSYTK